MLDDEISKGTYFLIKSTAYSIRYQKQGLENSFKAPTNFLNIELNKDSGVGTNETAETDLSVLGMGDYFDYTKPYSLVKIVANMACKENKESVVLDFFSGFYVIIMLVVKV